MSSPTDFNLSPYYDDFAESKSFHRILFRPAFAVQARELTQSQTILQNQVEKLGDHFFKDGAMIIPGQVSIDTNGELIKGKVGKDLTTEEGYKAAERCALSLVAHAKNACKGDLSGIKSCIKLTGYVNSTDDFIDQPKVINGASELVTSIFGDAGMHTRAAVSTNSLPLGVAVEVDAIFELN